MTRWYYAVIVEPNAWFNTAVRAHDMVAARRILADRYPHGLIHELTL